MLSRKVFCLAACSLALSCYAVDVKESDSSKKSETGVNGKKESYLNLKGAHERSNERFCGKRNTSAVAANPVLRFGDNIILEGDVYYGRQFTLSGYLKSSRNLSSITGEKNSFYNEFDDIGKPINAMSSEAIGRGHFYRNYTRLVYKNDCRNFRVVAGDTTTHNTIGFQQVLSGAGISVFRQSGDFSIINVGSPIVITRLSKVECKLNGEIIALQVLRPGVYSINDLLEEAKLPGVSIKISDQLSRSETLVIDYFSCYGRPDTCSDDWDFTAVWPNKWNLEDPHRIKYRKEVRCSTNYRYGYSDELAVGVGGQAYGKSYNLDATVIFSKGFGTISPNVGYSEVHGKDKTKRRFGFGIFYAIPKNDAGIHFETFLAIKEGGYGDLGLGEDAEKDYNELIEKCFATDALRTKYKNSGKSATYKQVVVRTSVDPIYGITPAFTFNGEWENGDSNGYSGNRLREYTLSFTTKYGCSSWVFAGGLTYDDPSKGRNLRSPDRRLTLACTIKLNSEIEVQGNYVHYDDEKRKGYGCLTYTPDAIKGLELSSEFTTRPGVRDQTFTVKYDAKFFGVKVEEDTTNTYKDKEADTQNSHNNKQRIFLGTSISKNGFSGHRSGGFNILKD
ncbi:MAG: hypothetical protein LBB21_07255 [Holosporaceae bacterium]|nr:hypothetical protein [Holosporaceae bacterium]